MKTKTLVYSLLIIILVIMLISACHKPTDSGTVATPTFNPPGGSYISTQKVEINCTTNRAIIRYTTNGSNPTKSSARYRGPISVSSTTTIKAKAFKSGSTPSYTARATYTIMSGETVATPTFNPPGGSYSSTQNVQINCASSGAIIRYTTNGSNPIESSAQYRGPISVSSTTTIKAKAFKSGSTPSSTADATYMIDGGTVATPTFNPPGGSYGSTQKVQINCTSSGAIIRYTSNGSTPTESSTQYSGPISVSSTTTIKAKAFKSGWTPSYTASATYTIIVVPPPPPPAQMVYVPGGTIYPSSGHYTSGLTVGSFYIDKYQITQAEYEEMMGANPSSGSHFGVGPQYPVHYVSWFNAIEYCNRRSIQEGLFPCYSYKDINVNYGSNPDNWPAGWYSCSDHFENVSCDWNATGYRLPKEEEWEYAARGGLQTHGYTYSGSNYIDQVAWYFDNSVWTTHEVGSKLPNELGIYDMSGNVEEWCWDKFSWDIYNWPRLVTRGGSWSLPPIGCTVLLSSYLYPAFSSNRIGFRVCRSSP